MKLSIVVLGAVALVGCATSGEAPVVAPMADDTGVQARATDVSPSSVVEPPLDRGLRLFAEENYAEAARAFEQAYSAEPEPSVLFAQAQALRLSGACAEAKPLYEAFLRDAPEPTYGTVVRNLAEDCE
jgi:tetratricopeptide (TPR) repeat protein